MSNVLDRIPLKHCFSNVNARRRGFSRGAVRRAANLMNRLPVAIAPLKILRNTQPKHFSLVRNGAPGGFSRWGGAPRSESEINDCRWQSHHKDLGSAAGASSGQRPLEAASYRFSRRSKKTAPGGTQPTCGASFCHNGMFPKTFRRRHPAATRHQPPS